MAMPIPTRAKPMIAQAAATGIESAPEARDADLTVAGSFGPVCFDGTLLGTDFTGRGVLMIY
jgi:hypothetical protein